MEVTEIDIAERVAKVLRITPAEFKACAHCSKHVFHVPLGLQEVLIDQNGSLHQLHEGAPPTSQLEERIRGLYSLLGVRGDSCEYCPEIIWMIPTKKGKRMPMQRDGIPHWGNCPGATFARRPR